MPLTQRLAWLLVVLLLFGCSAPQAASTPTPTTELRTNTPSFTATPEPSPTPRQPTRAFLFSPPGSDPSLKTLFMQTLGDLASATGVVLEPRDALSAADLSPDVRLVAVLEPFQGILQLAAENPGIAFIYITHEEIAPQGNLAIVGLHPDQLGFMAGFVAAVSTPDWRAGVLNLSDNPSSALQRDAFLTGVRFFCGICRPYYPPYAGYPLYYEYAASSLDEERTASAGVLLNNAVTTIYLPAEASSETLLAYLAQQKVRIIGNQTPPDAIRPQWLATIRYDSLAVMGKLWAEMLEGKPGVRVEMPIIVTDPHPEWLAEGRIRLVQQTLSDLQAGLILPVAIP